MKPVATVFASLALIVVGALAVLVVTNIGALSMALMNGTIMNGYGLMHTPSMMPMMPGMMSATMLLQPIVYALSAALLVLAVVWLARSLNVQSPLDMLKTRDAKGEISKEQFDAQRNELSA